MKINNKKMGIWNHIPTFIYPNENKLNTADLVKALSLRDFRVPGVKVTFGMNGRGMEKFKYVETIEFDKFDIRIWFCYKQGSLPGYDGLNDIAGVSKYHIRKHSATFYDDCSGRQHWVYTGDNWEKDLKDFRSMQFQNYEKPFRTSNKWLSDKAKKIFKQELQKLTDYVETFPHIENKNFMISLAENEEDFERYQFEIYPENYPTLYVNHTPYRISETLDRFNKNFNDLDDKDKKVGLGGERLVHLCRRNEVAYDPISQDGFAWAFVGEDKLQNTLKQYEGWKYDDQLIFELRPHYLDDIYVAELRFSEQYRTECFKSTNHLSNDQYNKYIALRGLHMVTLKQYVENGSKFDKPQYLIRKSIGYDEINRIYHIRRKDTIKILNKK